MELHATDIENREFAEGRRGYVREEVDRFLDEVAMQFRRYEERLASMAQRVAALEADLAGTRETEEMTRRVLLVAQRAGDEVLAEAEQRATRLLEEAQQRAAGLDEEVRRRRSTLEADIEALRRFEGEFRTQLRQSLEAHVALLQRTGRSSEAAAGTPPAATPPAGIPPAGTPQPRPVATANPDPRPAPQAPPTGPGPAVPGRTPPPPGSPAQPAPRPPQNPGPVRVADNEVLRRLAEGGRPEPGPGR